MSHSYNVFLGGPTTDRDCLREEDCLLTDSLCSEAIALMKHTTDEGTVMRKMKQTFNYRQKMIHDPVKSPGIFLDFPRFLDMGGLVCLSSLQLNLFLTKFKLRWVWESLTKWFLKPSSLLQVEQDFTLMFGEAISAKFLEKWPTAYKQKVLEQSRGLTQSDDLENLLHNAEGTTEVQNGKLDWIIKTVFNVT